MVARRCWNIEDPRLVVGMGMIGEADLGDYGDCRFKPRGPVVRPLPLSVCAGWGASARPKSPVRCTTMTDCNPGGLACGPADSRRTELSHTIRRQGSGARDESAVPIVETLLWRCLTRTLGMAGRKIQGTG